MPLIIDAHLDIAWNGLSFDRDQLLEVEQNPAVDSSGKRPPRVSMPAGQARQVHCHLTSRCSHPKPWRCMHAVTFGVDLIHLTLAGPGFETTHSTIGI